VPPPIPPQQQSPYGPAASRRRKSFKWQVEVASTRSPHHRQGDRAGEPDDDVYLSSSQVRRRYANASRMWLHRRLRDDSGFPSPIVVAGRKLWNLRDLIAWERQAAASA